MLKDKLTQREIDQCYISSGQDFVFNMTQSNKFDILEEIRNNIAIEIRLGVNLTEICQKYIWH